METHPALEDLLSGFQFDWWQATLTRNGSAYARPGTDDDLEAVEDVVRWCAAHGMNALPPRGGRNGYRSALPFVYDDELETVATLMTGSRTGIMPHLLLTGSRGRCAELAVSAQCAFPNAALSRADVFLDFTQPGLWNELHHMAQRLSDRNVKLGGVRTILSDTGRTFYLGSASSVVSLRVYEKDLERVAKGVIDEADADPHLVRIEFSFRPQSKAKRGYATLTPSEMLCTSNWAREFLSEAALLMNVTDQFERIAKVKVERNEHVKTLRTSAAHGVRQYAKTFAKLAAREIIEERFAGSTVDAVIPTAELEEKAVAIFREMFAETKAASNVITEQVLNRRETDEEAVKRIAYDASFAFPHYEEVETEASHDRVYEHLMSMIEDAKEERRRLAQQHDAELVAAVIAVIDDSDLDHDFPTHGFEAERPYQGQCPVGQGVLQTP